MDDMKIFDKNEKELETLIQTWRILSGFRNGILDWKKKKKHATLIVKKQRRKTTEGRELQNKERRNRYERKSKNWLSQKNKKNDKKRILQQKSHQRNKHPL